MDYKKAVLVSCFDWYNDRLKYIEDYLNEKGYQVTILMSDFSHSEKRVVKKYENIESVQYIHVPPYKKNISVQRLYSHKKFSVEVKKIIQQIKPTFVYCLVPPNSLVKELARLKSVIGYQLMFDVIDLWPESFPKGNTELKIFSVWRNLRDKYISCADKVILECEYYKDTLKCVDENKIEVLRLIKEPIDDVVEYKPYSHDVCLGYLGSINSLIDIERICSIISELSIDNTVLVRIVGDGERKDYFVNSLKQAGADVEYYGKIYDVRRLKTLLGNCHFGINIYKQNVKIGLTMKSVSYFQLGLPILNSISGDTEMLVRKYDIGINMLEITPDVVMQYIGFIEEHKVQVNKVFLEYFTKRNIEKVLNILC